MKYPGRGRSPAVQSDVRVHYSKYCELDIPSEFAKFLLFITMCHESPRAPTELAHALRSLLHTRVSEEGFLFSFFQVLENSVRFESGEMRRRLFAWKNTFGAYSLIAEIYTASTASSNFLINVLPAETAGLTLTGKIIYFPALEQNSMNRKKKERKSFYSLKGPTCYVLHY